MATGRTYTWPFGTGVSSYGGKPGDTIHVLLATTNFENDQDNVHYDIGISVPEGWTVTPNVLSFDLKSHETHREYVLMVISQNAEPGLYQLPFVSEVRDGGEMFTSFGRTRVTAAPSQ